MEGQLSRKGCLTHTIEPVDRITQDNNPKIQKRNKIGNENFLTQIPYTVSLTGQVMSHSSLLQSNDELTMTKKKRIKFTFLCQYETKYEEYLHAEIIVPQHFYTKKNTLKGVRNA